MKLWSIKELFCGVAFFSVRLELLQSTKRKFTLRTRKCVVAVAFEVNLQVVNSCKCLMAHRTREMVFHRQVNRTVALQVVFPFESFSTATLKHLDTQMDVLVALQGCRVVENVSTFVTNIIFFSTVNISLVHSQISRPCKFASTSIARKCIAVIVKFHVPSQLDVGPQFLSTYCTFVSDAWTVFLVVLCHCLKLEILSTTLTLERLLTVSPVLVDF